MICVRTALLGDVMEEANVTARGLSALPFADPITAALAKAPLDDEPVTLRDVEAVAEAESDVKEGRFVSATELRVRLGL